jgi:hypothetical protein
MPCVNSACAWWLRRVQALCMLLLLLFLAGAPAACGVLPGTPARRDNATPPAPAASPTAATAGEDGAVVHGAAEALTSTATLSESAEAAPPAPEAAPARYTIGDGAPVGSLVLTVTGVREPPAGAFAPTAGNSFLAVDVALQNVGDDEQVISSLQQMALQDASEQRYSPTLNASFAAGAGTLQTPDSILTAGEQTSGTVGFELPATAQGLVLVFEPGTAGAHGEQEEHSAQPADSVSIVLQE